MCVTLVLSPALLKKRNPPTFQDELDNTLFPLPSIAIELESGVASIIELLILAELSNKIKILAGTSPSPDPGGKGFAFVD